MLHCSGSRCGLSSDRLCTGSWKSICYPPSYCRSKVEIFFLLNLFISVQELCELYIYLILRVCISDVREEGGLATLEELREKFGKEKVGRAHTTKYSKCSAHI